MQILQGVPATAADAMLQLCGCLLVCTPAVLIVSADCWLLFLCVMYVCEVLTSLRGVGPRCCCIDVRKLTCSVVLLSTGLPCVAFCPGVLRLVSGYHHVVVHARGHLCCIILASLRSAAGSPVQKRFALVHAGRCTPCCWRAHSGIQFCSFTRGSVVFDGALLVTFDMIVLYPSV